MTKSYSVVRRWAVLAAVVAAIGCAAERAVEEAPPVPVAETDNLAPPFTAEQIRAEWTPGLTIVFSFVFPDRQEWQRWTVVEADDERALIQYLPLDDQGQPTGPPDHSPSRWTELRDHALFPAAGAQRERVSRETILGPLEGWLYEVQDSEAGTMSRFFFADELPGAPIWMETRSGEDVLLTLNQVARQRLPVPPAAGPETAPGQP